MSSEETELGLAPCKTNDFWSTADGQSVATVGSRDAEATASMRVFTSVMLHAWRQRRADVRRLQKVVDHLQKKTMYAKNELHVAKVLMRVEQKRCMELQLELKKSELSVSQVRSSCEMLTTSMRNLTERNEQLENELKISRNVIVEMENRVKKTTNNLVTSLMIERNQKQQLSEEQSKVQHLTLENERLKQELVQIRNKEDMEDSYIRLLEEKDGTIRNMHSTIETLEQNLRDQNMKFTELEEQLKNMEHTQVSVSGSSLHSREPPVERSLALMAEEYGVNQLIIKLHCVSSNVAFLLWYFYLPKKSMRYGCMPP